jgi:hypothetical protein
LLQKSTHQTFTDEDLFDEESVELIQKGKSEDGFPQSAYEKGNFILSEERFSSFQQAFQWCQRNRNKYFRHGKTFFADQLLEVDKYKSYFNVCNCHGGGFPNERKLEFQSTGLDSYQIVMYEQRGVHIMSKTIPKARGIDNRLVDYIDQQCSKDGRSPKKENWMQLTIKLRKESLGRLET